MEQRPDITLHCGRTQPLYRCDPVRIALHEWIHIGRDFSQANTRRGRWRVPFGTRG